MANLDVVRHLKLGIARQSFAWYLRIALEYLTAYR